ncbi:MAG: hypothetical protein WB626_02885 [Bacteroidota bacterium]
MRRLVILLGAAWAAWMPWTQAGAEPGGGFRFYPVSPAPGDASERPVLCAVRITDEGRPFTEAGRGRGVEAMLRTAEGDLLARIVFRDNGKGGDERRGDGVWTAQVAVRFPEGPGRLTVLARGEGRRGARTFALGMGPAGGRKKDQAERREPTPPATGSVREKVHEGNAPLPGESDALGTAAVLSAVFSFLGLCVLVAFLFLVRRWTSGGPMRRAEPAAGAGAQGGTGESWRSLFAAAQELKQAADRLGRDLGGTYRAQRELAEERVRTARELVSLSQSVGSVKELDASLTRALQAHVGEVLRAAGIETWEPALGAPPPPECEQRPDNGAQGAPAHSVTAVLRPGYRMRQGDGYVQIQPPVVAVAAGGEGGPRA